MIETAAGPWKFVASGASGTFSVNAPAFDASAVALYAMDPDTGVTYVPTYTVSLAADRQSFSVAVPSGLSADDEVVVYRVPFQKQQQSINPTGPMPGKPIEQQLDRAFADIQALRAMIERAIRLPLIETDLPGELPPAILRAGGFVYFDPDTGLPSVVNIATLPGEAVVTAFMLGLLTDASAGAALTRLGATAFMQAALGDANASALLNRLGFSTFSKTLPALTTAADYRTALGISQAAFPVIDNPGCEISQVTTNVNLTTTPTYTPIDRFSGWASGGSVSAGTMQRDTAASVGRSGKALKFAGITLTGSGQLSVRQRIEGVAAARLRNVSGSFAVNVRHDVGSAINYTVVLRKPTALDDYSGTTTIGTSSATSVPSGTNTRVLFENVALGDIANGLEIEVRAACGAVTTKNFWFTEFVLAEGATAPAYGPLRDTAAELVACQRFWEAGNWSFNEAYVSGSNQLSTQIPFKTTKRAVPTCTLSTGTLGTAYADSFIGIIAVASTNFHQPVTWTADARLPA